MTRKKWLRLRRRRPELGLPTWGGMGIGAQKKVKRMSPEQVIAQATADKLVAERNGNFYGTWTWKKGAGNVFAPDAHFIIDAPPRSW